MYEKFMQVNLCIADYLKLIQAVVGIMGQLEFSEILVNY